MLEDKHKISAAPTEPAKLSFEAQQLAKGNTLIPFWGYGPDGTIVALSCWDKLRPGQSLSDAARERSVKRPEVEMSPEMKRRSQRILKAMLGVEEAPQTPAQPAPGPRPK